MASEKKNRKFPGEDNQVTITIKGEAYQDLDYLIKNDGQEGKPDFTRSAAKAINVYANFLKTKNLKKKGS
jgi:hypothetical protein